MLNRDSRPIIKFSRKFAKIRGVTDAKLIDVAVVQLENLSLEFIKYDTDGGMYDRLPKRGEYLMLIFSKGDSRENIFTTLRRATDEKRRYYRNQIGRQFVVVVEDTSPPTMFEQP